MNISKESTIDRILSGEKKIEFRIGKEKWQDMQVGDFVDFTHTPESGNPITIRVTVADILTYPSFEELLDEYDPLEYVNKSREELLKGLIKEHPEDETGYYTREEIETYRTFGILLENPTRL